MVTRYHGLWLSEHHLFAICVCQCDMSVGSESLAFAMKLDWQNALLLKPDIPFSQHSLKNSCDLTQKFHRLYTHSSESMQNHFCELPHHIPSRIGNSCKIAFNISRTNLSRYLYTTGNFALT